MHFTQGLFAAVLAATSAVAAPAQSIKTANDLIHKTNLKLADIQNNNLEADGFPPANVADWTVEGLTRPCAADGSSCTWSFHLQPHTGRSETVFNYVVPGPDAAHNPNAPRQDFGDFYITAGWNDGYTVLAVHDLKDTLISFMGYTDEQVANGATVPDQDWKVYIDQLQ